MSCEFMTDAVWERIGPLLPPRNTFGRPRCADRDVMEGILWVLKTGARWRDLPKHLPSASTCWRRLWIGRRTGFGMRSGASSSGR